MWYPAAITDQTVSEPVTAAEVKAQTIIDHNDDDTLVNRLIEAARSYVEAYCGLRLVKRAVAVQCDSFCDFGRLPEAPVLEILSVHYVGQDGVEQVIADGVYELRRSAGGMEAAIVLKPGQRWPVAQAQSRITVAARVGYDAVPPAIKHAVLLWIADAYAKRPNDTLPSWTAFDALLCNFRRGA